MQMIGQLWQKEKQRRTHGDPNEEEGGGGGGGGGRRRRKEEEDTVRRRRNEEQDTAHELAVQKLPKDSAQALKTLWPPPQPPNLPLDAPPSEKRGRPLGRPLLTEGGACHNCRRKKTRCDGGTPCESCRKLMIKDPSVRCVYGPESASGGGGGGGSGGGALGGIGHPAQLCISSQESAARRLAQEGGVGEESNESNESNSSNESKKAQLRWYYRP